MILKLPQIPESVRGILCMMAFTIGPSVCLTLTRMSKTMNRMKMKTSRTRFVHHESLETRQLLAGDTSFAVRPVKPSVGEISQIAFVADLDNDGLNEAIAVNRHGNGWYDFNEDFSRLEFRGELPTRIYLARYNQVSAADLDGDGDLDLITERLVGDGGGGYYTDIKWLENDDLQFEKEHALANGGGGGIWTRNVSLMDIDEDGDLDAAYDFDTIHGCNRVWGENTDGRGKFVERWPEDPGSCYVAENLTDPENDGFAEVPQVFMPNSPTVDLDGDGDLDFISTSQNSTLTWHESENGTLIQHELLTDIGRDQSVYPFDIDSDGDLDIIVHDSKRTDWLENIDGSGTFSELRSLGIDQNKPLVVGDYDTDGTPDLFASNKNTGEMISYQFDVPTGTLKIAQTIALPVADTFQDVIDLDEDGDLDIIGVSAWYEQGEGLDDFRRNELPFESTPQLVRIGDIDNDSKNDIISLTDGQVVWYSPMAADILRRIGNVDERAQLFETVDFDGDNDLDVVWSTNSDALNWFENLGGGNFADTSEVLRLAENESVNAFADLDGDDDLDLLISHESRLDWVENINGTLATRHNVHSNGGHSLRVEDIDGDGDMDIADVRDGAVWIYKNEDGLGRFGVEDGIFQLGPGGMRRPTEVASIEISDVDADGDLDFLIGVNFEDTALFITQYDSQIVLLENVDGLGTFESQGPIAAKESSLTSDFVAVDLNHDGLEDLISTDWTLHGIYVFENVVTRETADINRDGVVDAADIDRLCLAIQSDESNDEFDLNDDGLVDLLDVDTLVFRELNSTFGDINLDGRFDSSDLVQAFASGHYNDEIELNSNWTNGDWNCDQEFDSSDLVTAFQKGNFSDAVLRDLHSDPWAFAGFEESKGLRSIRDQRL